MAVIFVVLRINKSTKAHSSNIFFVANGPISLCKAQIIAAIRHIHVAFRPSRAKSQPLCGQITEIHAAPCR
jgi:hypothetical protein